MPAGESSLKISPPLADPIRRHEQMSSGQRAGHAVMSDSRQAHGRDATALLAVRISSELAWSDLGGQVGGDGFSGPRKDAVFGISGWRCELLENSLGHVQLRVFDP